MRREGTRQNGDIPGVTPFPVNCLELPAVHLALNHLKRHLRWGASTGPHGQNCDRCVHQPTTASCHSHSRLAQPGSRRVITSCAPRRVETPSPDGPADLETFRTRAGRPVRVPRDFLLSVVLLPVWRNTRHGRAGTQLAAGPLQVCISPSEPSRKDTVQDRGRWGADPVRSAILAHSDLVPRADSPRDSPSLAASSEERSTHSETGHLVVLGYLPQEEVDTITLARAPSTRHA